MDQDRIGGIADKATGSIKSAVGNVTGDAKLQGEGAADKAAGTVRNAVGSAKDAVREVAGGASERASDLGQRASRTLQDETGPLLDQVGRKASEYGREARDAMVAGAQGASSVVRGYPIATVGIVAVLAFLVGRVTAPEPKPWYHRDWL